MVLFCRRNAFRARPINDGIKPMRPASVEKRPLTKPEPFNLTETHSRSTASSQPEEHSVKLLKQYVYF